MFFQVTTSSFLTSSSSKLKPPPLSRCNLFLFQVKTSSSKSRSSKASVISTCRLKILQWAHGSLVGQHLFFNIIFSNFMAGTGWKLWCDWGMRKKWLTLKTLGELPIKSLSRRPLLTPSVSISGWNSVKCGEPTPKFQHNPQKFHNGNRTEILVWSGHEKELHYLWSLVFDYVSCCYHPTMVNTNFSIPW
jgi:hypothetical protein